MALKFYQWLGPLIAIFFIYRIVTQFRNNKRLLLGTLLWVSFWFMIAVLSIKPDFISIGLAESLGFANNVNAVIFVALAFLFIMTYYQSSTIDLLEKQMTELVRRIALEKQDEIDKLKNELDKEKRKSKKTVDDKKGQLTE